MRWKDISVSRKGAVIGGVASIVSVFGVVYYILFILGGVVSITFLFVVAGLTFVKLVWGVLFGFLVGSLFDK